MSDQLDQRLQLLKVTQETSFGKALRGKDVRQLASFVHPSAAQAVSFSDALLVIQYTCATLLSFTPALFLLQGTGISINSGLT